MRANLLVAMLTACAAFGQDATVSRVFHTHYIETEQNLNEFSTMVGTLAGIRMTADFPERSVTTSGTPAQIAIADWMFGELDRLALPEFATGEFKVPNKEDDVVRVFILRNAPTVQAFQELATSIRTVAEIPKVFTFDTTRELAVRGTADQVAAAGWMVHELDQPADAKRADSPTHKMTDPGNHGETDARVFYLPFTSTIQQFQEAATLVRTVAEVRRVFTYNSPRALTVRGTTGQVALVDWMIQQLAKPANADTTASPVYTYDDFMHDRENIVRIFYVTDTPTVQAFQQVVTQIRTTTKMRRVFTYNASKAMAVRGTADQIAMAEQMLKDRQIAAK
jgi:hypothetical protein